MVKSDITNNPGLW